MSELEKQLVQAEDRILALETSVNDQETRKELSPAQAAAVMQLVLAAETGLGANAGSVPAANNLNAGALARGAMEQMFEADFHQGAPGASPGLSEQTMRGEIAAAANTERSLVLLEERVRETLASASPSN